MVNDSLKRLLTAFIILWAGIAFGQSDSLNHSKQIGRISISAGLGASADMNVAGDGNDYENYSASAEQGAALNYQINTKFTIGAALGYQNNRVTNPDMIGYERAESRLNIALRGLYHLNKYNRYFDHYAGIRMGPSFWTTYYYPGNLTGSWPPPTINYYTKFGFQILYGLTLYPGGSIFGFNLEAGLGSPFLFQGGILLRFGRLE